jgi:hypothetical protein
LLLKVTVLEIALAHVITLSTVGLFASATNIPFPNVTDRQSLSLAEVREVQLIPSGLVITRFPVPLVETATNNPFPCTTECQRLFAADVREVQLIPSGLVITEPSQATATNNPPPYVTLIH